MPHVYVSAFELKPELVAGDPRYHVLSADDADLFAPTPSSRRTVPPSGAVPTLAVSVARQLREAGLTVIWFHDFWDYPTIEETISDCSVLVAVVDAAYFSSTGKAIELTYAAGQLAHGRKPIPPIPILVLPLDGSYENFRHLASPGSWTVLRPDAHTAVQEVISRTQDRVPPRGAG